MMAVVEQARGRFLLEEERRLHQRLAGGEESALLECFDRIGQLVFCAALAQTSERAAAEDLTTALFVELWRTPEEFDPARGPLGLQMIARLADHTRVAA